MNSRSRRSNPNQRLQTAPLPRNVKLAIRSLTKQDNKTSVLVKGPVDPPSIRNDIVVEKVVELSSITSPFSVTYNTVYAALDPSTTPFFTSMRVMKISAYGPVTASTSLGSLVKITIDYDGAFFTDRGTGSGRGAALHVRFPEHVREVWTATSSTTEVASVVGGATNLPVVVQVTVQVRANPSAES